jgi:CubicO group peptidase (beta-lactamase class C family)
VAVQSGESFGTSWLGAHEFHDAEEVARALVVHRVAPDASVGWAVRGDAGWELGVGHAAASGGCEEPIFDLASLTKPMTAFAVAHSRLARTAMLGDVLAEARGTASEAAPVELLLAHRAGLDAHRRLYEPVVGGGAIDREAALRVAADARRPDAPGPLPEAGFPPVYSDLGFILVGEALARIERGRDAGEVVERIVVRAIGCEQDLGTARSLEARRIDFSRRVRPTEVVAWRGGEVRGRVHDENAWALTADGGSGHAGMFGTVRAVLAFGCAVHDAIARGTGPLAGPDLEWLVRARAGGTLRAGFDGRSAAASSAGELAGPRTYGHLGFTGTSFWIDPDAEAVVAVLTNRVHPTRDNALIRAARPAAHDALFAIARRHRAA